MAIFNSYVSLPEGIWHSIILSDILCDILPGLAGIVSGMTSGPPLHGFRSGYGQQIEIFSPI